MQKLSFDEHLSIAFCSGINLLISIFLSVELEKTIDEEFVMLAVGKNISFVFSIPVTGSFLKIYNDFKNQWICNEIRHIFILISPRLTVFSLEIKI